MSCFKSYQIQLSKRKSLFRNKWLKNIFKKSRKIFNDNFVTFDSNSIIRTGGASPKFWPNQKQTLFHQKTLIIVHPPPAQHSTDFQIFHQLWDLIVMVHYRMSWLAFNQCFYLIIKIHVWYVPKMSNDFHEHYHVKKLKK